ncbi:MAG TPA: chitobiase/beta-hexosaminidase C-terminal domain-containing protein, partial [Verrucomicrobiae bacterium]|nr:chitobiase/beta-hexosaminidase C-terminal domain-containing protein [Verrucomicrobiae bacterium]
MELYNSSQNLSRDNPGGAVKYTVPVVVNGKVYVGAQFTLSVFGPATFVATPQIAPNGGLFTNSVAITLTDATPGATIFYTVNGTAPTTNSTLYTGPFTLTNSAAVQAVAWKPGAVVSGVASASFLNSSALGDGTGLLGQYWSNHIPSAPFTGSPIVTRLDPVINFNWGNGAPDPKIGADHFTVRWSGSVEPQFNEPYTFYATTDDGVRLYVNGQQIINQWVDQSPTESRGTLALKAQQRYNIEMDYYENGGGAVASLSWSSPSTLKTNIPTSQLYPVANPPPGVVLSSPADGASYTAPASVTLAAAADAQFNDIDNVTFYANGTVIGVVSNNPYVFTATGLPAGNYALVAVVTDATGLTGNSAPVNITVKPGTGAPYGLTDRPVIPAFLNMPQTFNGTLPAKLSQTGVFADVPSLTTVPGLIPYAPNTPLWSDGALKTRWMAVPFDGGLSTPGQQISFAPAGEWGFPTGTIFVKHFELATDETNTNAPRRRLETRLLVRDPNGTVYGVTYRWRADNSDADLLTGSLSEDIIITNSSGTRTQTWYYPSPADCLACHTPAANYVLGVKTRQLNGSFDYASAGVTDNQLRALNHLGLFNPAVDESLIGGYAKLSAVTNQSASLEERFRSYIDANCAQCHRPGGTGPTFDARYDTPLTNQNVINGSVLGNLGYDNAHVVSPKDVWRSILYQRASSTDPLIKMPQLARNLVDANAMSVVADWINSLPGTPALPPPSIVPGGGTFSGKVTVALLDFAPGVTIRYTLDGSLPDTNSVVYS